MAMKLSILDLAHVPVGSDVGQALRNTLDLARRVDGLGYERFWLAEHHNMPGIASAATSVVIGQVAAATQHIRVGAGGIMLPNHAPLVIAEQFGTLESLFPGRIDLGLGRAPGMDGLTWRALRRDPGAADRFPDDVRELQALLGPVQPGQRIRAVPGADTNVPLWVLGSSLFGAQLAAQFGLPYAFASHFAPQALHAALQVYRERFQPSPQLDASYAMAGVNVTWTLGPLALAGLGRAERYMGAHVALVGVRGLIGYPLGFALLRLVSARAAFALAIGLFALASLVMRSVAASEPERTTAQALPS